jgi:hypothetical protein
MRYLPIIITAFLALPFAYAQASDVSDVERALAAGDTVRARQIAAEVAAETPDIADRLDWMIAQSHLREGAPRAALPYLERLVNDAPADARLRLELARTLFLMEEDGRARVHFEQALGAPMALTELQAVYEYLDVMERRKSWEATLRFAVVPETNTRRLTSADSVVIGGLVFDLQPSAQAAPATGVQVGAGFTWLPRIAQNMRGRVSMSASARMFEDTDLNSYSLRAETGVLWMRDHGVQFGGGLMAETQISGGQRVVDGLGLYATWQGRVGRATMVSVRAEVETLEFPTVPTRNGHRLGANLQLSRALSSQLTLNFSAFVNTVNSADPLYSRDDYGVSLGGQYVFEGGFVTTLTANIGAGQVEGVSPLFSVAQRDQRWGVTARLMHRDIQLSGFSPVLEIGYDEQRSNIPISTFDNAHVSLGVTRRF